MLRQLKQHTAAWLLFVFVLGGFGGPVAHRMQHAMEIGAAKAGHHDHAHPRPGDATLTKVASGQLVPLDCLLCASLVYDAGISPVVSDALPATDGISADNLFPHSSLHRTSDRARAPPAIV